MTGRVINGVNQLLMFLLLVQHVWGSWEDERLSETLSHFCCQPKGVLARGKQDRAIAAWLPKKMRLQDVLIGFRGFEGSSAIGAGSTYWGSAVLMHVY